MRPNLPDRTPVAVAVVAAAAVAVAVVVGVTAVVAAVLAAPAAVAARTVIAADAEDVITVQVAASSGRPAFTLGGAVTGGGIAVDDDIADQQATTIAGQASLAGGATADVRLARSLGTNLKGTITVTGGGRSVAAFIDGPVTRGADDETFTWSGTATVTDGGAAARRSVTVTVVDGRPDPGEHALHLKHAGWDRIAIVHLPQVSAGQPNLPVLYHFPGLLENANYAEMFEHPFSGSDAHGYVSVIPEHFGWGWQGVPVGTPFPDVDDPGFVRQLTDVVQQRFGTDPRRTYASGMSNGGFFTSLLGCKLSDVFAAFAPVSGQLTLTAADCGSGRPVPVLMMHGDADPIVPYSGATDAGTIWAGVNGCRTTTTDSDLPDVDPADGTTVTVHRYDGCPDAAPVLLYQIHGGGHSWPGGTAYPVDLGKVTHDIDANEVIWSFVSQYRLP